MPDELKFELHVFLVEDGKVHKSLRGYIAPKCAMKAE